MVRITAELEVWLVSDPLLASQWRELARHLSLTSCVPRLEATNRRRLRRETEKVGELLRLWQTSAPHTYTVPRLLSVLDQMGMKSLYEWVELMTKDRVEQERLEQFVRRSNTPAGMARLSRPLSLLTDSSGLSQSSCSPPGLERRGERRGGGVFTTLYRPGYRARQSCYIPAPTINLQPSTPTTPRPQSAVLQNFDRALAEYNQLEGKKKRTNIETEKYFDNLAALLR